MFKYYGGDNTINHQPSIPLAAASAFVIMSVAKTFIADAIAKTFLTLPTVLWPIEANTDRTS
jgi:hypothetical protein